MAKAIAFDMVEKYITENLDGVVPQDAWGERSFFYNPGRLLKRGTYFATLKQKDGDNDKGSNLDRDDVWRLNFGVQKDTL